MSDPGAVSLIRHQGLEASALFVVAAFVGRTGGSASR